MKAGSVLPLTTIMDRLRSRVGSPHAPSITDPFQQILLEQVAYLATDEKRLKAFQLLKSRVGLEPEDILSASDESLLEVASSGGSIAASRRASRLRESAWMVCEKWDGDLTTILSLPHKEASRALSKFAMIGKPGADKILLLAGVSSKPALDSNGLRVLLRIGYGTEDKNYDKSYRTVMEEIVSQSPMTTETTLEAHLVLKEHGRTVCKRSSPACKECPLEDGCEYGRNNSGPRRG